MTDVFPIVGVGASAGGVEALEGFFPWPAAGSWHRTWWSSPISARRAKANCPTSSAVTPEPDRCLWREDGAEIRPNTVHVMPADAVIGIRNGRKIAGSVTLGARTAANASRSIIFFSSLAVDQHEFGRRAWCSRVATATARSA